MEQITERIAGVSLSTVLLVLVVFSAVRLALQSARATLLRAIADLLESAILAIALVFLVLRPFVVQSYFIPSGSMRPTLWEGDRILVNKWLFRTRAPQFGEVVVFRAPRDADPEEKEFIKRVVGLPGDRIEVSAGCVVVGDTIYTRSEIRATLGESLSVDQAADTANLPPLRLTSDALWLGDRRILPSEFARAANHPAQRVEIHPGRVLRNGQMLMECYVTEDPQYEMGPRVVPPGEVFVMGDNRNQSLDSHIWGCLPTSRVIGRAEMVFWPPSHARRIE